jgi:hypothetical protein
MLKGDTGLFRGALLLAGFLNASEQTIFNDFRKIEGFRRLKLWFADSVADAPQEQQRALQQALVEAFGDRIISMYFVEAHRWYGERNSLCIRLRD